MLLSERGTRIEGPQDRVLFLLGSVLDQELEGTMDWRLADMIANRVAVLFQQALVREDMVTRRIDLEDDDLEDGDDGIAWTG